MHTRWAAGGYSGVTGRRRAKPRPLHSKGPHRGLVRGSNRSLGAILAELELFYDGLCRLCSREMAALKRLDRGRGRIAFVDIAAPSFDAAALGHSEEELMARIHARHPQGSGGEWLEGMEVFRRAYRLVGLGWLLAPTGWPLFRPLFDAGYRWFARNRYRFSGSRGCEGTRCAVPSRTSD